MESHSPAPVTVGPRPAEGPPSHYPETYSPEPARPKSPWKRIAGAAAAVGLLILNFGAKLKFVLLALTKVKLFTTSASALVSVAAYALIWGWSFAVGFVALLFVHELGHVLQLRREGIKSSPVMFIPFLGAVVAMKELPKDAGAEARVGLAGPVLGSLGCLIPVALWLTTGEVFFQALAYTGFLINLFNLLPVLPLDGGRAMAALTPWMWGVGWALLIGMVFVFPNPILLLVVLVGGFETYRRWKERKSPESKRYNEVSPRTRALVALSYVGLVVILGLAMAMTYLPRSLPT